ncbi:MAG TPA: DUF6152 family protein [Vicinamibacterales bacterium]|jgi:uncharacterized protein DUF6152|nr:DUF6152 family protein [Vicinamibacterales bacterium]
MRGRVLSLTLLALVVSIRLAAAHHSFSAVYDSKRSVTVTGVVTQFRFVNPHALLSLEVTDKDGKVVTWVVEFAGRLNLSEVGWTADSIRSGEKLTVTGNPTHEPLPRLSFQRIVKADGSELRPAAAQRNDALEEERRERAKRRTQQP